MKYKVESLLHLDLEADTAVLQFLLIILLYIAGSDTLKLILTK
jgi:hypothetical protein